jgi:hypothetical protein
VKRMKLISIAARIAYRSGVTAGISAPDHSGVFSGLGTFFSLGTSNKLERVCFDLSSGLHGWADWAKRVLSCRRPLHSTFP